MIDEEKNFVVDNEFVQGDESKVFFHGEDVEHIRPDADLPQVLFKAGVFSSRTQAKKNLNSWLEKLGWDDGELPGGFIQFRAGKKNFLVTVLKPTKSNIQ